MKSSLSLIALSLALVGLAGSALAGVQPVALRTEYLANPIGVDAATPRLQWQLEPGKRGTRQTAYQILVGSSAELLKHDQGDLWDSGEVKSDQSIQVAYAGKPLLSRQQCFWKVRVWDQDGKASAWSAPASWSMGLLKPEDWQAQWIGVRDEDRVRAEVRVHSEDPFPQCSWIWFPEGNPAEDAPPGTRYFRRTFELPAGKTVKSAEMTLKVDNAFTCEVNGQRVGSGSDYATVVKMDVKSLLTPGRNLLAVQAENQGDLPNPAGVIGCLKIEFESGEPLVVGTDGDWKSLNAKADAWDAAAFDDSTWVAAKVLGPSTMAPWGGDSGGDKNLGLTSPLLRKEFEVAKPVVRATAYVSGLGLSEFYLNGAKVSDDVLSPALSQYDERVFYVTRDVTSQIKRGRNAVGVWLGDGRYSWGGNPPKLLFQLEVDYADGSRETICSDSSWRLTVRSPILYNNEYNGEEYDARREIPGWASPGFDDSPWKPGAIVAGPRGILSAQMINPIRVVEIIKPISMKEIKPGVFIYDLGQNMAGRCRLKVSGPAGTRVTLRHAEMLYPDGSLNAANIRSAKATDIYTLKGGGKEIYEPRFTYHGFRFVELTGFPGQPTLDSIEACVVNDDVVSAGEFSCSQPMINRIYHNIVCGVRSTYRSIAADDPARDERVGWMGDRVAECRGETYSYDVAAFYAKWAQDMADEQHPNGSISDVCPSYWGLYTDNVTWPCGAILIPGMLHDQYADREIIRRVYPNMVKWIDHMTAYITNGIITRDTYGDWCVPPEDPKLIHSKDPARQTAPAILASSYFYHCLQLMSGYAKLVGKPEDEQRFNALAEKLKTAFNEQCYNREKGYYDNGTQTACVLPLAFGLVPPEERPRVFAHLVKKIEENQGHIATGLVGGQWINRVLTDGGRPDLAYGFATNTTYPSWGYMVEKGATTIWELWNGDTADPAMNTHNLVMLIGDSAIWLYEDVAGIKPDLAQPGFKHILMQPHLVGDLKFVKATHRSPYGLIASEWQRDGAKFDWRVTIPPNSTATVYVPATASEKVFEGSHPAAKARGVKFVRFADGTAVFEVASGSYRFMTMPVTQWRQQAWNFPKTK
jgi:alpha-L-rhamnosidase